MLEHIPEFENKNKNENESHFCVDLRISQARLEEKFSALTDKFITLINKMDPLIDLVNSHDKLLTEISTEISIVKIISKPLLLVIILLVSLASGYKIHDFIHWIAP